MIHWAFTFLVTLVIVSATTSPAHGRTTCNGRFPSKVLATPYHGQCYAFVTSTAATYQEAQRVCSTTGGSGGTLALVKSGDVNDFLARTIRHSLSRDTKFWIGLDDLRVEGVFRWADGSRVTYENFAHGQGPRSRHIHSDRDCVVLDSDGLWFDYECDDSDSFVGHDYICQFTPEATPGTTPGTPGHTGGSTDGYSRGSTDGYSGISTDGFTGGSTDGFTGGSTDGFTGGSTDGFTGGSTDGFTGGSTDGYSGGSTDGFTGGSTDGFTGGSTKGITDGLTDATTAEAVTTTPPLTPENITCPPFNCALECGIFGFKLDLETGCLLCECDYDDE